MSGSIRLPRAGLSQRAIAVALAAGVAGAIPVAARGEQLVVRGGYHATASARSSLLDGAAFTPRTSVPGAQLWAKLFRGVAGGQAEARAMAVSRGGATVFVTGSSRGGAATGMDYTTVAYRAATGARLWTARYHGPGSGEDAATAVAVSPDGSKVFVTGYSGANLARRDYVTVAYRAATGARLWTARYNDPGNSTDMANALAVGPCGATVFVTGLSRRRAGAPYDYVTVAYRASTGARLWAARYNGPGNGYDAAQAVAVNRGGTMVFVTGASGGRGTGEDYATVAYRAATGARLWVARYNGPGNGDDIARSLAVSGPVLYVTGESHGTTEGTDYATIAYRTATGARLWTARYNGSSYDVANALTVSRDGSTVFVTGGSGPGEPPSAFDFATVAYRAATGAQLWAARYDGPGRGFDQARSVAVSPDGAKVFVTGESWATATGYDYATIAYRAATGARLWLSRYAAGAVPAAVAVSQDGRTVFVTGTGGTEPRGYWATVAYRS